MEANIVIEHLICDGFKHGYRLWIFHGEASSSAHCTTHEQVQVEQRAVDRDEIPEMLRDMAYGLDQMGEGVLLMAVQGMPIMMSMIFID